MAGSLRRLVLLAIALGVATMLMVGAMATLTSPSAKASPVLKRDQAGAVERGVTRDGNEPKRDGSSPVPAVALVLGGLVLAAALPPAARVHVYYHRLPGSYWR
jgi:hypothetical protein